MTTGEILQSSRLSNDLMNTGGHLSDGEVQSSRLSNELVTTREVFQSSRISDVMVTTVHNISFLVNITPLTEITRVMVST